MSMTKQKQNKDVNGGLSMRKLLFYTLLPTHEKREKEMLKMAHMIETMFSVREKPWHGLGTIVMEAPASAEALKFSLERKK